MLDYNHRSSKSSAPINDQLNILIDDALVKIRDTQPKRRYLGASQLGVPCSRLLQYEQSGDGKDPGKGFSGQTLRIFAAGHVFEELAIKWLRDAGFELLTNQEDGSQFGFSCAGGNLAGHVDGIIIAAPKALGLAVPALWEMKSMNNKSWKETIRKGLVVSKPVYAAQIALYQAYMEGAVVGISKNPALFTAINKDTAELYHELIPFDGELAQRMSDKAANIIRATKAGEMLPRIASSSDYYECKMCAYQQRCWGNRQ